MSETRFGISERKALLKTLEARFAAHPERHPGVSWSEVAERIADNPSAMRSLHEMERTGGEPDVIRRDTHTGAVVFCDCSPESPSGRRSTCYDRAAWEARKENRPATSALEMAESMGVELLSEAEYRELQTLGEFDRKTSSWVQTPAGIRALGGALFCDRRYGTVFLYHNGAQSYYAARGFRSRLSV